MSLILTLSLSLALSAGGDVPTPIQTDLATRYPNATHVRTETLKDGGYMVTFREGDRKCLAEFDANGMFKECQEELDIEQMPAPVRNAEHRAWPKAKVVDGSKITKSTGEIVYEVDVRYSGRKYDVYFSPQGMEARR